jgi:4-hydroxy 2-oxovalerate aldolase
MIGAGRYEPIDILVMIEALSGGETPTSYRAANIDAALAQLMHAPEGADDVTGRFAGRPVLLVAGGAQAARHWPAVHARARVAGAEILAINLPAGIPAGDVDAVICIHPARMMALSSAKEWETLPLYTARDALPERVGADVAARSDVTDYGVSIETDTFTSHARGCIIPAPETIAYAWALAEQGGASELWLAGFDGYDGRSDAFLKTSAVIATLRAISALDVHALTATHFDLPQSDLYAE